ncbi:MAG: hypothetical protein WCF65_02845 [Parachlamydiaceae bacterium]
MDPTPTYQTYTPPQDRNCPICLEGFSPDVVTHDGRSFCIIDRHCLENWILQKMPNFGTTVPCLICYVRIDAGPLVEDRLARDRATDLTRFVHDAVLGLWGAAAGAGGVLTGLGTLVALCIAARDAIPVEALVGKGAARMAEAIVLEALSVGIPVVLGTATAVLVQFGGLILGALVTKAGGLKPLQPPQYNVVASGLLAGAIASFVAALIPSSETYVSTLIWRFPVVVTISAFAAGVFGALQRRNIGR